jgi:hypothetical protein
LLIWRITLANVQDADYCVVEGVQIPFTLDDRGADGNSTVQRSKRLLDAFLRRGATGREQVRLSVAHSYDFRTTYVL